jgi:hypothetical protein
LDHINNKLRNNKKNYNINNLLNSEDNDNNNDNNNHTKYNIKTYQTNNIICNNKLFNKKKPNKIVEDFLNSLKIYHRQSLSKSLKILNKITKKRSQMEIDNFNKSYDRISDFKLKLKDMDFEGIN